MSPLSPTIKYHWTFTCGHIIKQDDPTGPTSIFNFTIIPMSASEPCTYCKEFKPIDEFTKIKAQIYKEDYQALQDYASQVETVKKKVHDGEAGGETDQVEGWRKILECCSVGWAEQMKKVEKRNGSNSSIVEQGHPPSLSAALEKNFTTALGKVELFHWGDKILLERARGPLAKQRDIAVIEGLERRCEIWGQYVGTIKGLGGSV
ncbi:hypothetical protein IFR05_016163 [Cadophora sp. M221]|nr:hypothetical protein IFR05_016163 [Cadophora sp. M221]